jgi:hypothetical protein
MPARVRGVFLLLVRAGGWNADHAAGSAAIADEGESPVCFPAPVLGGAQAVCWLATSREAC